MIHYIFVLLLLVNAYIFIINVSALSPGLKSGHSIRHKLDIINYRQCIALPNLSQVCGGADSSVLYIDATHNGRYAQLLGYRNAAELPRVYAIRPGAAMAGGYKRAWHEP